MKKLILGLLLALPLTTWAESEVKFTMRPSLTPDAKDIYFEYDSDIWKVPTVGGQASRVTSMAGYETYPIVSPDGKWLAFCSGQNGDNDVYVVSTAGGDVKQLTFSEANDAPRSWTSDSKSIIVESNQYNKITSYSIPVGGGTMVKLFPHFFNTIANVFVMNNGCYLFNESTESYRYATRKGYKGDHNPNIKMWNPNTKKYSELTSYEGKDIWPTSDKNNNIFFATHRFGDEANLAQKVGDKTEVLTKFDQSIQYPRVSYNGEKVVFNKDYDVYVYDTKTKKSNKVEISLNVENAPKLGFECELEGNISRYAVSQDGEKFAFVSRGRLFVSNSDASVVKELNIDKKERVIEVKWSKDNKTLYYTRTRGGWYNLFSIDAASNGPEKAIYTPDKVVKNLGQSPDYEKVAFTVGTTSIAVLENGKVSTITDELEIWPFRNSTYLIRFSQDGKMLTFNSVVKFESDIFIYDFETKELSNITNTTTYESYPVLSNDKKSVYFAANRFAAAFPRGLDKSDSYLFRVPLNKFNGSHDADKYKALFSDSENKESDNAKPTYDLKNLHRRWEKLRGNYVADVYGVTVDGVEYILYTSSHAGRNLPYILNVSDEDSSPKLIEGVYDLNDVTTNGQEVFTNLGGTIYEIDVDRAKAYEFIVEKEFAKSDSDEFAQMVYEAWAQMKSSYYDPNMHGVDWDAKLKYYSAIAPYVQSRSDLRLLLNDMLNELNSSHLGFNSNGAEESIRNQKYTEYTGIMYNNTKPYEVDYIVADSPADKVDVDIKKGDKLVAVNGVNVDESKNRDIYFTSAVNTSEVTLTLSRGGKTFDVTLSTISQSELNNLLYYQWEDDCRARVDKGTNDKVAYVHLRDMTGNSLDKFIIEMMSYAVHKDALILDLRYNTGGNIHNNVLELLTQKTYFEYQFRNHESCSNPNITPGDKPIVVLINQASLSDAEVTAEGIKALNVAKVVGTETYRWIIFTTSVDLVNGSSVRMPAWGCYTLEGKDLEHTGVAPDIYVKNTFADRMKGDDPQLDRAIEEILKDLKK